MRKNNQFMVAYIFFLFLASAIGGFLDEVRWNAIVCGATIASYFFAFSDYFYQLKSTREDFQNADKQHGEMTVASVRTIRTLLNNIESQRIKDAEFLSRAEHIYTHLDECMEYGEQLTQRSQKYEALTIRFGRFADILSILGVISFLCIAVFFASVSWLAQIQNTLTVSAFAIIMFTQYLREYYAQSIRKKMDIITLQKDTWQRIEDGFVVQEKLGHAN